MLSRSDTLVKAVLFLGFAGVSGAILAAHLDPASGYELSIYTETSFSFWVATCFALLASILVVFSSATRRMRTVGAFLGGFTMLTIVSLPIIRGYHYVGESDSLSHLGTARDMNAGLRPLTESRYPIVHTLGSVLHDVTGLELNHSMLILVVAFVVCFFVFVPLVVRQLSGDVWTTYVGLFSGLLLLPINHLSPSLFIHPTSQAIMYSAAFLFVFFLLYRRRTPRHSAMFLLVATMFVLLHPQQAGNLVLFFGVIAAMQIGYDVLKGNGLDRRGEWVIPEVAFYSTVFWLWVRNLPIFSENLARVIATLTGQTQVAESSVERSVSLAEVGGSLPEVFVKLFLVTSVYALLTGLLMLLVLRHSEILTSLSDQDTVATDGGDPNMLPLYIFGGLAALMMVFLTYLVGGISDQYFRHLGMLMVFGTILGAIMIGRGMRYVRSIRSDTATRASIVLGLVLLLALSLPVVFSSPYIYYSSNHVTEKQMHGYETTFEYRQDSMVFAEVRSTVYRYGHAIQGTDRPEDSYYPGDRREIPDHFADRSLRRYYDESIYVPVTEADRTRDPIVWNGFRFDRADFDYLDNEPGIEKVQTNGGYDLYLVKPVADPSTQGV